MTMITIFTDTLDQESNPTDAFTCRFYHWKNEDVYTQVLSDASSSLVPGTIRWINPDETIDVEQDGDPQDQLRILVHRTGTPADRAANHSSSADTHYQAIGYVRDDNGWHEKPVQVVSLFADLYSRNQGLLETDILADRRVLVAGLGSGGAPISLELGKAAVKQILVDHDRIEVANVIRHVADLSDVGRFKTHFMADKIKDKNPDAEIATHEVKISWQTQDLIRPLVQASHLVIGGIDDPEGKVVLNKLCVEEKKPMIMAGTFRRAHGGQVLFVRPGQGPCYQCFLMGLPEMARDQEIASESQAQRIAYSDRLVAIEPGLSNDIAPFSQMVVKLAIQYLLDGKSTTLRSLDEDLVAPWYLWLNRREAETQYEKLEPLEYNIDGMHIMRWYGIDLPADPACPCCGNFIKTTCETENIDLSTPNTNHDDTDS